MLSRTRHFTLIVENHSWLTGDLLKRTSEARSWLRAHVIGSVSDDGGLRDRCASRVLESALMLHLLRVQRVRPAVRDAVSGYLVRCRESLGSRQDSVAQLELALISAVLGEKSGTAVRPLGFLDDFDHFTSPRKRFMFRVILTELGVDDADQSLDLAAVNYDEYATWVNLEMCALKVLAAHHRAEPALATDTDRAYLHETLASGSDRSVFEADVFAHVLGLLAVRRTRPESPLIADGIEALLRCQNQDGGFPFIAGWEPFLTAVAGIALVEAGAPTDVIESMGDYVARHQGPDGGWPFAPRVRQSDADCSPYCLEFLRGAGERRFAESIDRGDTYLETLSNDTGGFATYYHGNTAEIGVTGSAVAALATADRFTGIRDAAVRYLLDRQQPDGTFERGWSLSEANAIMRALIAFAHYPEPPSGELGTRITTAVAASTRFLVESQDTGGGWGHRAGDPIDVLSTAYSLIALGGSSEAATLRAGLEYLLSQQEANGGFSAPPDSAGPRPLPHDAPVLADCFALLAMSHLMTASS
ncbi:MAG: prenyltransferase/squalene oxidase repeat-containing protein [Actinophytocola sp.]|uniref:prenyltransferase/squalene oxidase repeat-containing protein n=1 Tax=Actinophytocola sp. TaxID=1872138 RepID=UPI003C7910E6